MREDVKQQHFSLLSVRPGSVFASRPFFFVERVSVLTPKALTSVRQGDGSQLRVCVASFHAAVSTPLVAKLRKPTVGLGCQPSSYVRLKAYGFFGLSEGA